MPFLRLRMSWSSAENQQFLELLEKYPAEKSQRKRWEKISNELGSKTLQLRCKILVINKIYISTNVPMVPAECGMRLMQNVPNPVCGEYHWYQIQSRLISIFLTSLMCSKSPPKRRNNLRKCAKFESQFRADRNPEGPSSPAVISRMRRHCA